MSFPRKLPHRDLLWWIVPFALTSLWIAGWTIFQGEAIRDGFVNPRLILAAAAALCALGFWLEQEWARWLALTLLSAAAIATLWLAWADSSLWRMVLVVPLGACAWQLWRLPLQVSSDDDDEPFVSLVLLFREPQYLDAAILAQLASLAWNTEVDVVDADVEEMEGPDGNQELRESPEGRSLVGGAMPHFFCFHPPGFFTIHCFDEPYFDDPHDVAATIPELRAQQAIAQHRAWLSVDLLQWMDEDGDPVEPYRLIGKLLAELADKNCLAVLDPAEGMVFVYDPETERKLRSANPLEELRETYYAPIATIDGNDTEMKAAVAEAQRRWPEFVTAFEQRNADGDSPFLIKAPFSYEAFTEFMWVQVTGIENHCIYGKLGNEPANIPSLHEGSRVRVKEADVNDWMCVVAGKPLGGFTLKVLGRNREDE